MRLIRMPVNAAHKSLLSPIRNKDLSTPDFPAPAANIGAGKNLSDTSVSGCILRAMSPLCPPPGFPPHLAVIWPLIWAQILVLRAMVRAAYGKGTPYRWSVTPWGLAFIVSIHLQPGQKLAVLKSPVHSNIRIAAALDGRALTPAYARNPLIGAHPGESCEGNSERTAFAPEQAQAQAPGFCSQTLSLNLPLPET